MITVPNQKIVTIEKEPCGKGNLYAAINLKVLEAAAQDLDAFDQTPNTGNHGANHQAGTQDADQQLSNGFLGVTQIEVVNAQAAQEDTQKTCNQLALGRAGGSSCQGATASGTYSCVGQSSLTTVGAVGSAYTLGAAALNADSCIGIHSVTTVFTIHIHFLLFVFMGHFYQSGASAPEKPNNRASQIRKIPPSRQPSTQ